jgi:hypothetical protein
LVAPSIPEVVVIQVRDKLRIRLRTLQDPEEYGDIYTVNALPPSDKLPFGRCHCVLIRDPDAMATDLDDDEPDSEKLEHMDINGIQGKHAIVASSGCSLMDQDILLLRFD